MKTVLMIFLIFGTSLVLRAQISKSGNDFKKRGFSSYLKNDSTEYFSISPKFKTGTSSFNFKLFENLPEKYYSQNNPNPFLTKNEAIEFRMPVAGGSSFMKMPILVPDSTVHFYIKEKRIDYVNPLERNYK